MFARQDVLRDPPFSRMDLIACRNLLIYIKPEVQTRAVARFHFGLREGGHLFLGNAETIGRADDLFEPVSKKWRIYRRIGPTRHDIVEFPMAGGARPAASDRGLILPGTGRPSDRGGQAGAARPLCPSLGADRPERPHSLFPWSNRRLPRASHRRADARPAGDGP